MDLLPIGKMAALNHITVQTSGHYDKIDLLKPLRVDEETNYRYYDIKQSAILDMIQYMKSFGMSLEQIQEQLDKEDIHHEQHVCDRVIAHALCLRDSRDKWHRVQATDRGQRWIDCRL